MSDSTFLSFPPPPPRSIGREYRSLTNLNIQLEEEKMYCLDFPVLNYGFGQSTMGLLQFIYVLFMLL